MNDPMYKLIEGFPRQMKEAIALGNASTIQLAMQPKLVVITGLGGSGIGGKIISQLVSGIAEIPVLANNDYFLPNCVNAESLVVICSYSGNTEETLNAMDEARLKGASIFCITSGGKVLENAVAWGCPHIVIPGGEPPRSQFGYPSVLLIFLMKALGILGEEAIRQLNASVELLEKETPSMVLLAKRISSKISRRVPIIYAESSYEGVAIRWRQQFNENAKMLCCHSVVPEMNHNELVGWAGGDDRFAALILRNQDDFIKNKIRVDISQQIMSKKSDMVMELMSKGDSRIERMYYLVHLGDWISYYLAMEREVDPIVIDEIDLLKSELSKY